jgi:hypothetical protein
MAECWLDQGTCDRVLVGGVEETGEVLMHCATRILGGDDRYVPGEGAVFLTLAPHDVGGIGCLELANAPRDLDLMIVDVPAIISPEAQTPGFHARRMVTFSPYFGHTPSSSAFQLLGGLLSLSAGRPLGQMIHPACEVAVYSGPVDNAASCKPSYGLPTTILALTKA